jgi:imidazolonepropionase-like amidohydrolase
LQHQVDISSGIGLKEESLGRIEGNDLNEEVNPITPELLALDGINPYDESFPKTANGGVTASLILPGLSNNIGGRGAIIHSTGNTVKDMTFGMRFSVNSIPKSIYLPQKKMPMTRMGSAYLIREALYKTKEYGEKKKKQFSMQEESLLPVLEGKQKAFFAALRADDIATSIRITKEFNLNTIITFAIESDLVLDIIKENKIPVAFGPVILSRFGRELKHLSPKVPATLIENGIATAIISGHPLYPAEFLRIQLGLIIAEGISTEKALAAVTSVPAKMLGMKNYGTIKKGAISDLVLFDGDPWETKTAIKNVFINGKLIQ